MSDFNLPTLGSTYANFLSDLAARDVSAITLCYVDPSNIPAQSMKWNRAGSKLQEYIAAAWEDKVLSIAGGGTGSATAAGARTAIGLGTMAVQDDSAVAITGGTIAGVTANASIITAGTMAQARLGSGSGGAGTKVLYDDQTYKTLPSTSLAKQYINKSGAYGITAADIIAESIVRATSGTFAFTLPTTNDVTIDGLEVIIKNVGSGVITLSPTGGDTFDGASSLTLPAAGTGARFSFTLRCNKVAANWEIV